MWTTSLLDVSLHGVMVKAPADWTGAIGSRYRLDLRLEDKLMLSMGVELMRLVGNDLAFMRTRIDLDSFSRLKRFVELNLGNTRSLDRELSLLLEHVNKQ